MIKCQTNYAFCHCMNSVRNKIIRTQSATVIAAQNDTTVNNESLRDIDDTD